MIRRYYGHIHRRIHLQSQQQHISSLCVCGNDGGASWHVQHAMLCVCDVKLDLSNYAVRCTTVHNHTNTHTRLSMHRMMYRGHRAAY